MLEVVGRGGMGIVLRAFDEKLHRVVAIKVLAPALAASGPARQRFVREARAAAAVTHDNVIAIHAVEDAGAVPYLVMQFIDGPTLQEKIDREGSLPLKEILRIGMQIAAGLAAAHAQGLVHRDVKPANILLENGVERVKITDFGLARAVDDASLSRSGVIAGTPAYMSPEQAGGGAVDHRSDLFSLGSVLYALCTGHAPFRAATTMAVLKEVCDDTPRPIREVNPDIPDWLEAIIERLHAKDPADRFQTAAEVADLLGRHLARLQQANGVVGPVGRSADATAGGPRQIRSAGVTAVLLLLGGAVLVVGVAANSVLKRGYLSGKPARASGVAGEAPPSRARPPGPDDLASLPSPVNARKRQEIPLPALTRAGGGHPDRGSLERVAGLGDEPFLVPRKGLTHWMAQTADGRLLAVPCGNTVVLYEARTGALVRILTGPDSRCYRPAFSPDGKRLACGVMSPNIQIWDVETGRPALTLEGGSRNVLCVTFDGRGTLLASADWGGTISVWDAVKGKLLHTINAHSAPAHEVAFSPDGTRLVSVGWDNLGRVWDPESGRPIHTLEGHADKILSVAFRRDGTVLATGSEARVILWDAETYRPLRTLETAGAGLLAFTPDGQTILTAGHKHGRDDGWSFSRWDVKTGARRATVPLPGRGGLLVARLGTDGRTIFAMSCDPPNRRVGVYDVETGREWFPPAGHLEVRK